MTYAEIYIMLTYQQTEKIDIGTLCSVFTDFIFIFRICSARAEASYWSWSWSLKSDLATLDPFEKEILFVLDDKNSG